MAKFGSASSRGGDMDDDEERDRRLVRGPFSVEVRNTFPEGDDVVISGTCKFKYKTTSDESPEGDFVRDRSTAAIPSRSVLVFESEGGRCVSEFRVDLVAKKGDVSQKTTYIKRVDRPGRCWSYAAYNFGPKK